MTINKQITTKNNINAYSTNENKYFIDPESGLKYSNEIGSVVM